MGKNKPRSGQSTAEEELASDAARRDAPGAARAGPSPGAEGQSWVRSIGNASPGPPLLSFARRKRAAPLATPAPRPTASLRAERRPPLATASLPAPRVHGGGRAPRREPSVSRIKRRAVRNPQGRALTPHLAEDAKPALGMFSCSKASGNTGCRTRHCRAL